MELNTRNRGELKKYFVKNAIPTEGNFAELIEGTLNQRDDGIAKLPGDPLSLEAAGDSTSQQKVLRLYRGFEDDHPQWTLNLNPRKDPAKPETARPGLNVADGQGESRLFIDASTGRVGVGTIEPSANLTVSGDVRVLSDSNPVNVTPGWKGSPDAVRNVSEISNDTGTYKCLMVIGNRSAQLSAPGLGRRVGIWDVLDVHGDLNVTLNVSFGKKVRQMLNLWGTEYGIGVQGSTLYFRSNTNFAWYRGGSHADGQLDKGGGTLDMVIRSGKVGIGTASPAAALHVVGTSILAQEGWQEVTGSALVNNWKVYSNEYNSPAYFKDSNGIVHLKGLVKHGTVGSNTGIFRLPSGYRPARRELQTIYSGSKVGRCDVRADGWVIAHTGVAGSWYSLDGITFRAGTAFAIPIGTIGTIGAIGTLGNF